MMSVGTAHAPGRPARPRRRARAFPRLPQAARGRVDLPAHRHRAALDRHPPGGALMRTARMRASEGRAAPAHRGHARARADLRARRAQPRRAAVRVGRGAAPRVRVHRPAVVPRPLLRGDERAAHRAGFRRARRRVLRARARAGRRACRDLLRPAGAHGARRRVRDGDRRPVVGGARRASGATASPRSSSCASCATTAPSRRWRRSSRRCRTASGSSPSGSTRPKSDIRRRSSRASSSARWPKAGRPSRTPARKGRRPTSGRRSTCCASRASITACAAWRIRRSSRGCATSGCR